MAGVESTTLRGTLAPLRTLRLVRVRQWTFATAVVLAAVFVLVRVPLSLSPALRETYYDEALTGLMSLAILRGVPQVFYWGQPYLGAVDAYLAAAAFHVFGPSTFALRLGTAWVSVFWVWAGWRIGRRIAGERWGLLAGLQLAVPPIFLTFMQLSNHAEGVALALGTVTLAAAVHLVDPLPGQRQKWAWVLLGSDRRARMVDKPDRDDAHRGRRPRPPRRPPRRPGGARPLRGSRPVRRWKPAVLGVERAARVGDVPPPPRVGRPAA